MTPENEAEYRYLWDGSEDWILLHSQHNCTTLSILFAGAEPNMSELIALRQLLPDWQQMGPREIKERLAGCDSLDLGLMPPEAATSLAEQAELLGLKSCLSNASHASYSPLEPATNGICIIENDDLAAQICERMLQAGVRVVEEL